MRSRCLRPETLRRFGIRADESLRAWSYPAAGGTRYKAFPPTAPDQQPRMKYWHTPGTPAQIYRLDLLAIPTPEVWLVNGEPSVWTCQQAGLPAVCTFGEGNLPADAIDQLMSRGVRWVRVVFDLDEKGHTAAAKVYQKLREPLIVTIHRLPQALGKSGDACDLYVTTGGDDKRFRDLMLHLPDISLPALADMAHMPLADLLQCAPGAATPTPPRRRRQKTPLSGPRWWVDGQLLREVVETKVKLRRSGVRWVGRCPFHDDHTPSLTVYPDGGFKCFGCEAHGTVVDFVALFDGIPWKEALQQVRAFASNSPGDKDHGPASLTTAARGVAL
jgi:hypothetical protein